MSFKTTLTLAASLSLILGGAAVAPAADATWSIEADYIEACSCSLFCQCYFNPTPEGGHFCQFNNAVKVSKGHVGDVKVDGCKVWLSGDLGGDLTSKEFKSLVMTFDPSVKPDQQKALMFLMGQIYPVKWSQSAVDSAPITWEEHGTDAYAKLGDKGEVKLTGVKDKAGKQTVIENLPYWGAQTNTGFRLAKGTHFYKGNGQDYTFKERNGFMIHIASSGTVTPGAGM
ncbi:MAG: DUF1326 domain-containing protein [Acidobacteriota bacterium]